MRTIFTTLVLLLSITVSAYGETGSPNFHFRPMAKRVVQRILDQGINRVGDVNMTDLLAKLDTVEWRTFDLGFLSGSGGQRHSSIYIVKDKMVVINMLALQSLVGTNVSLLCWALHESLGALGYPDDVYDMSTAMCFISEGGSPASVTQTDFEMPAAARVDYVSRPLRNFEILKTDRVYGREGGTTIIGGGGDAALIEVKRRLLRQFLRWMDTNRPLSNERNRKRAVEKLLKMNIHFSNNESYNSTDFRLERDKIIVDMGGYVGPSEINTDEYADRIITQLGPVLLP